MSNLFDWVGKAFSVLMAWLNVRAAEAGTAAPEPASTVVTTVGSTPLTYAQVDAVTKIVEAIDFSQVKSILEGKATVGNVAVVAEDLVKLAGVFKLVPRVALTVDAIEGFAWLVQHNGKSDMGYYIPPQVMSGRSARAH